MDKNIKIARGAWFEFDANTIIGCDPIGAVLLKHDKVPPNIQNDTTQLVKPGFLNKACSILNIDHWWLHRFWMGFDAGHIILLHSKKDDKEITTKDEVSEYGFRLRKEIIK